MSANYGKSGTYTRPDYLTEEIERVKERSMERNFISRNYTLKRIFSYGVYLFGALISVLTGGLFVFILFQSIFNDFATSVVLAILLVAGLQIALFFVPKAALEDYFDGINKGNRYEVRGFIVKVGVSIVMIGVSIYLSLNGAPQTGDHFTRQRSPIELVALDSIQQHYDVQFAALTDEYNSTNDMRWKKSLTEQAHNIRASVAKRRSAMTEQMNTDKQAAIMENAQRRLDYEDNISNQQPWFYGIAGLGELLCLFALFFIANYEKGAAVYVSKNEGSNGSDLPPPPQNIPTMPLTSEVIQMLMKQRDFVANMPRQEAQKPQVQQIGFKQSNSPQPPPTTPAKESVVPQPPTTVPQRPTPSKNDISRWKANMKIYYKRSDSTWSPESDPKTLDANFERYCEYRIKLEETGMFDFELQEEAGKRVMVAVKKKEGSDE